MDDELIETEAPETDHEASDPTAVEAEAAGLSVEEYVAVIL